MYTGDKHFFNQSQFQQAIDRRAVARIEVVLGREEYRRLVVQIAILLPIRLIYTVYNIYIKLTFTIVIIQLYIIAVEEIVKLLEILLVGIPQGLLLEMIWIVYVYRRIFLKKFVLRAIDAAASQGWAQYVLTRTTRCREGAPSIASRRIVIQRIAIYISNVNVFRLAQPFEEISAKCLVASLDILLILYSDIFIESVTYTSNIIFIRLTILRCSGYLPR